MAESEFVRTSTTTSGVRVITIANGKVNLLALGVRRALLRSIDEAEHDDAVRALVLTGGRHFSAGADLEEFDTKRALLEPTVHADIAGRLDASRLPSVAAIGGAALGGGLELALACSARVASPGAVLGLPETTLGLIPGAGGTQRLPRAVGMEAAISLIRTGRIIAADEAARLGLVHLAEDPLARALEFAAALADGEVERTRLRDADLTATDAALADLSLRDARRRGEPAHILMALEAVSAAAAQSFGDGLHTEHALFLQLVSGERARASRYRFLSERHLPRLRSAVDLPRRVAIVGAGVMGRGIARAFLSAGFAVVLVDTGADVVDRAISEISSALARSVESGRLASADRDDQLARLEGRGSIDELTDVDLVIEAVAEVLELKKDVFARLDAVTPSSAVLASNTSSLDLDAIAAATRRPDRVVGLHFFSPANVMKLVEVVEGAQTSSTTLDVARAVVGRLGKLPVVSQVGPGFIGNRIFDQYVRQALQLVAEGVRPWRIDEALERWGMAMGPFRVLDVVGNDITRAGRRAAGEDDPVWALADRLADEGLWGRKSGAGWYRYSGARAEPHPDVDAILPPETPCADSIIVDRMLLALMVEASRILRDGIAASPADIDTVLVNGYGFPAWRGGPMFLADSIGWSLLEQDIDRLRAASGDEFWNVAMLEPEAVMAG